MRHHLIPVRRLLETANVSEGLEKREPLYNCGWECKLVQSLRKTVRVCMRVCSVISDPCNPMGCSPPGSPVPGTPQERILEWVAISSSRRIFLTQGSNLSLLHCRWILYLCDRESPPSFPPGPWCAFELLVFSQMLTEVFLPGESQGWGSLVGCCLWGHTELDTTEVT